MTSPTLDCHSDPRTARGPSCHDRDTRSGRTPKPAPPPWPTTPLSAPSSASTLHGGLLSRAVHACHECLFHRFRLRGHGAAGIGGQAILLSAKRPILPSVGGSWRHSEDRGRAPPALDGLGLSRPSPQWFVSWLSSVLSSVSSALPAALTRANVSMEDAQKEAAPCKATSGGADRRDRGSTSSTSAVTAPSAARTAEGASGSNGGRRRSVRPVVASFLRPRSAAARPKAASPAARTARRPSPGSSPPWPSTPTSCPAVSACGSSC